MGRCGCDGTCQCAVSSTACIAVTGTGTAASPFAVAPIISPDSGNLLECRANGLYAPNNAAWTTWVPTWANLTVGNGTVTAEYQRIGRVILFEIKFVLGSTSAVGTNPTYTLPVTAAARYTANLDSYGATSILDSGTANFNGPSYVSSTTIGQVQVWNSGTASLQAAGVTATLPMTWGTADGFTVKGWYEAAS